MRYNYCTLFDSAYLNRGILLYRNLRKHARNFHLYVVAFDNKTLEILNNMNFKHMTVISLKDFEDPELLKIKPTRSKAEYCWTCSSSVILHVLEKLKQNNCTYIDADMLFYQDPKILIQEMGKSSVSISLHSLFRSTKKRERFGKYCVQFMTFKKDKNGLTALKWWRNRCLEWCYARLEDGKFGDQLYLDDWLTRFKGIHVIKNIGAGVAPWNLQEYDIYKKDKKIYVREKGKERESQIVFYHYHQLKYLKNDKIDLCGWKLSKQVINIIYKPILNRLKEINSFLKKENPSIKIVNVEKITLRDCIKYPWRAIHGRCNVYKLKNLIKNNDKTN